MIPVVVRPLNCRLPKEPAPVTDKVSIVALPLTVKPPAETIPLVPRLPTVEAPVTDKVLTEA